MSNSHMTENLHAPFKDQIDDETVLFDLDNSLDATPYTPNNKLSDIDSDTQKTQSSNTAPTASPRRETRSKGDTNISRVSSFANIDDAISLEDIHEYEWADSDSDSPSGKHEKDSYIVQEVLSDFLKIKSFKRKYPDLHRRSMDAYERSWLQQEGFVSSGRVDIGLTALKTDEVMKLLQHDYPEVHEALSDLFRRRKFQAQAEQQKRQYQAARIERGEARAEAARRRAMDSASDYNHQLVSDRFSKRQCYWDLQTMQIHVPQRVYRLLDYPSFPKGAYPVAVIPGQFSEYYSTYTPEQLSTFPLSRVSYPRPLRKHKIPPPIPSNLRFSSIKPRNVSHPQTTQALNGNSLIDFNANNGDSHLPDMNQSLRSNSDSHVIVPNCAICGQLAPNYLRCSECKITGHHKCLDVPDSMLPGVRSYAWSCMECKRCLKCNDSGHEDQMMFCDLCDRGCHVFCAGLKRIPDGKWECLTCIADSEAKKRRNQKSSKTLIPIARLPQAELIPKRKRGRPPKIRLPVTTNPPLSPSNQLVCTSRSEVSPLVISGSTVPIRVELKPDNNVQGQIMKNSAEIKLKSNIEMGANSESQDNSVVTCTDPNDLNGVKEVIPSII